ncbi:MAG TPA: deoxyguanosinetriphosphate triphosphohydrolase [Planctomycetota bacterium]|nr:deoxyguanosinetriphosphate triphosphohydrolase [Planctomycetota bacterium]
MSKLRDDLSCHTPLPGMCLGEDMQQREERELAPYAMHGAESRGRLMPEQEHASRGVYRGLYQRDRDRIIHSRAFRRLEYKTQVFVNHEGDHYRTRLTHTLEVSQISRTIARVLRLNEDLVEAIALAHDLGHTPFGHSGEDALGDLMKDHGGFEHNSHGLRVVDKLEKRYPHHDGLNLTYEIRESFAKHTTRHDKPDCQGFNPDERPPLESQVIEAADEIAYNNHDLEDGLTAGIITLEDLDEVELWAEPFRLVGKRLADAPRKILVYQTIATLINLEATDLMETSFAMLRDNRIGSVADVRAFPGRLISFSESMRLRKSELEDFLFARVYRHYRVARMAGKAHRFIIDLFRAYTDDPQQLPPEHQEWSRQEGVHRAVCDYIAGMTDRHAQDEYKRLFYPFERV